MTTEPLLAINGVAATYNHAVAALHDVSFSVRVGEIKVILGANGAGKTTTLRAISNILSATRGAVSAGSIKFDGRDVFKIAPSNLVKAGLASVLEGRHVFKSLTIEENLLTGSIARGSTRKESADDLARIYELFPSIAKKRRELAGLASGGEQQMVAIGRALASRPRVLLLDEPSMGLAPIVVHAIFETLNALNAREGLTILMAEQNAAVALRYAHTATVIENGVTVLTTSADELRRRADIKEFYLGGATSIASRNSQARAGHGTDADARTIPLAAE